jgi:beta-glucosidase
MLKESGTLTVSVMVRNEGRRAAEEPVFLFMRDKVASVTRPLLELKGFERIALEPGTQGSVTFSLPGAAFRFLGLDMKPVFEAGEVEILAGPAADRARLVSATVILKQG